MPTGSGVGPRSGVRDRKPIFWYARNQHISASMLRYPSDRLSGGHVSGLAETRLARTALRIACSAV